MYLYRPTLPADSVRPACMLTVMEMRAIFDLLVVYTQPNLCLKVVLRLSTTFAPVLQHGRIATIVICLHTLRRVSTRKLNRFWQNWHLQRWLIVKSKSKMASRPRQRPSTTEKPTMTFSVKPRLICIITKRTGSLNEHSAND